MDIEKKLIAVQDIYNEIEHKIGIFKQNTGLNCVPGCGECCNRFEPYISILEALVVSRYLQNTPKAMENFYNSKKRENILCPFYIDNADYHCGIYTIRPFICRMYGFSVHKKKLKTKYLPCPRVKEYYTKEMKEVQKLIKENILPIYEKEYKKLCELDFKLATDLHPLITSIEIALENSEKIASGFYEPQSDFTNFVRSRLKDL